MAEVGQITVRIEAEYDKDGCLPIFATFRAMRFPIGSVTLSDDDKAKLTGAFDAMAKSLNESDAAVGIDDE